MKSLLDIFPGVRTGCNWSKWLAPRMRSSLWPDGRPEDRVKWRDADLLTWSRHFLPAHFAKPASEMHVWIGEKLDGMRRQKEMQNAECRMQNEEGGDRNSSFCNLHSALTNKLNVVGPRGSAKSTVVTLAHVLREALEGREKYIWIVCDTRRQAVVHLENVKHELLHNERIYDAYPRASGKKGPMWQSSAIVLPNGVKIEAIGSGQAVRGLRWHQHRPTMIVCDDLQNDRHIHSPQARDQDRAWFQGMVMKAGTTETRFIHLGTALHRECLAMELHETPGWVSRVFRSIIEWPVNMEKWAEWEGIMQNAECRMKNGDSENPNSAFFKQMGNGECGMGNDRCQADDLSSESPSFPTPHSTFPTQARAFYEQNRLALDAGAHVLWPAHEDLYSLMCMRAENGRAAFEREKQSVPAHPELCEWPEDYFGDWIWFDEWPKDLQLKTMALDPSKGTDSRRGDFSAFVMLGISREGVLYVEADMARRPSPQIVSDGVELCKRFRPHALAIEENQCRDLLGMEFTEALKAAGLVGLAPHTIENMANKQVRIRRLGPHLARKNLRFRTASPSTRLLVEQLKEFPIARHDDGPDALEMAVRLAESIFTGEIRVRR